MASRMGNLKLKKEIGQGLTEFALVLPILLIVAIGLFDIGRAFYTLIVVTNASREGARYLALHPDDGEDDSGQFNDTKAAVVNEASNSFITLNTSGVVVSGCVDADTVPGCDTGIRIQVQVSHNYRPLFAGLFPATMNLTRATQMMVP